MSHRRDRKSPRGDFIAMLAVLVAVAAFVVWDAIGRSHRILDLTGSYGVAVDAPASDARSPTGYAEGRRSLLLPAGAADSAHWVIQTQAMFAEGEWRIRRAAYDNAPHGREVHWASPLRWWLGALAWLDRQASGRPMGVAVERATLLAGPAMLGVALLALLPLLMRKFSCAAAAVAAVACVANFAFYTDFVPGRADHHGLANLCGLFTVLFLVVGSFDGAKKWFRVSAVAGGCGLWISAATQAPLLIGAGLGVLAAGWCARRAPQGIAWLRDPNLLRTWGLAGGAVSFAAYLVEYFPSHLGLRLEVNHPLYAIAWIGAGEVLRVYARAVGGGWRGLTRHDRMLAAGGLAAVALLPLTIAIGATATFAVADPFLWQLHALYIAEFQGLGRYFAAKGFTWGSAGIYLPVLLLVPPLAKALRRSTPPDERALLVLACAPALLAWILGSLQIRWLGQAGALVVPVIALLLRPREKPAGESWKFPALRAAACLLVLAPGAASAVRQAGASDEFSEEDIRSLAERDVAHWLRLRTGPGGAVVAAAPSSTTRLELFGGHRGVGTLYWENVDGLKAAAELFAAPSAEAARALAHRRGITHIVLYSWDAFEVVAAKLHRGLPHDAPIPGDLFVANLLGAAVPPLWLRAIPFRLPEHPVLANQQVRIWEVTPEQTPAEAAAHAAGYFLELKQPALAQRLAPTLAAFGDDLAASVMLAGIASRQRDAAGFGAAFPRVLRLLPRSTELALGDHLHLVVVLVVGERIELAREQLAAAMRKANEANLRQLTPGSLSDLLALSEALGVELPEPGLKALAQRLIPPVQRK